MTRSPGVGFAVSLGAVTLIGPLAIHLFLPVMPAVKSSFGISDALVQLTFSITLITMAVVTLVYGSLSDRYGRRPVLLAGLSLFVVGSAMAALTDSVLMLILGRMVQAIGAGCGVTLTRAIARDAYGPDALIKAIAYLTMAYTIGPMIAPPLGGVLMDAFGWRSAFWFAVITGVLITVSAYFVLTETRSKADIAQRPMGIFRPYLVLCTQPRFVAYVVHSGCMSLMFFAIAAASPFLMRDLLGRSATEYGFFFCFFPLGYCTGNWISSRLSGRASIESMIMAGSVISLVVVAAQSTLILDGYLTPYAIFVPGGLLSFAQGLALPNAQAGAMRVMPGLAGTAAGLGVFMQMFLSAVSIELYGLFADGTPLPMIVIESIGGTLVFIVGCICFAIRIKAAPGTVLPERAR
jgi:DHA1 family bicyclomycin/chloramphenicol resistance-like MFS transporter